MFVTLSFAWYCERSIRGACAGCRSELSFYGRVNDTTEHVCSLTLWMPRLNRVQYPCLGEMLSRRPGVWFYDTVSARWLTHTVPPRRSRGLGNSALSVHSDLETCQSSNRTFESIHYCNFK